MGNFPIGEQTNYSIETGEEFALEFMLKRVNPRQLYNLSPPVEANNQSSEPVIKPIQPVSRTLSKNTTKVLCSFGGKIVPRPSDRKLRYVGGETRILRIGKEITWDEIRQRTFAIYPEPHSIKYQLPGEDLDLLVSVSCEEDVQNMMDECSVIDGGGSRKKLRVFLVSENENVDGNSDGSQQIARDTDCIDKNEPNHESEMKSDEKDKSACFGVGAGTLEHGDIINDINDRFPRDLISDIFGTAESSVGVDTHTAGMSVNMKFTDPKYWTLFERFAPGDFRKVSLVDQEPDIVTLPSDYDISQTNGVESLQSNQEISSRPVVSDDQDVKRTIQPAGVPLVDKNEPKHESEMKSALDGESALTPLEIHQRKTNEKDKSAHFGVGAGTLEHGDIFLQRPFSSGDFIRF